MINKIKDDSEAGAITIKEGVGVFITKKDGAPSDVAETIHLLTKVYEV